MPGGNLTEQVTDYTSAGLNRLEVTRYYDSTGGTSGSFGTWRWNFDRHLSIDIAGNEIDAYLADGMVVYFVPNGSGGWKGVSNLDLQLAGSGTTWTLTDWNDSVETYTAVNNGYLGLLTSVKARDGYTQTLQYNGSNQLTSVTDSYGRKLTVAYGSNGMISSVTTPDGKVYSYSYSTSNPQINWQLLGVTHPDGSTLSYLYEDKTSSSFWTLLTGVIDENGNRYRTWTYDDAAAVPIATSSQLAGGAELKTVTYNNDGSVTVTNPLGLQEVYKFSQFQASSYPQYRSVNTEVDRLATATTAAAVKKLSYDANGFLASTTDWNGNTTAYTNDTRGDPTSRVVASGTSSAETITTTWSSTFHLPTQISEPLRTFSYTYDSSGNKLTSSITGASGPLHVFSEPAVTKTRTAAGTWVYSNKPTGLPPHAVPSSNTSTWSYTYNATGEMLTAADPLGNTTHYAYDAAGNLTSITNASGQATTLSNYDSNGRPGTIQDPNGLITTLTYNFRGQMTSKTEGQWLTTYTYDAAGELTKLTRPDGSSLTLTYDAAHRLTAITDSMGNQTVYTLDAMDNVTKVQVFNASNALIRTRSITYDALSRILKDIGASGQTTSYSYDPNNNLLQIADPLSHVTSGAYDALNRLTTRTDANGGITTLAYDSEDRAASVTDPRGLSTSYAYDALDDVVSISSPDTGATSRAYDAAGNLVSSTDARGDTSTFTYDALNRLTKASYADGTSITYQYDQGTNGIGRLTTMVDAGGSTTWSYNNHGQVVTKQQTIGGTTLTTTHNYSATTGQLSSSVYPSGSTTTFAYDPDGRVDAMGYQAPGGSLISLLTQIAYEPFGPVASWQEGSIGTYIRVFDEDGRIVSLTNTTSSPQATVTDQLALTYDAASRITGITETGVPPKTFSYDVVNRLATYANGLISQTYSYDADGNRTGFTMAAPSSGTETLSYGYAQGSNHLLSIGGSWSESFSYDASGNMLSHDSPYGNYTYTYNARNRRAQSSNGAVATTDVINGLNQRTAQTQGGATELFAYDEQGHLSGTYTSNGVMVQEIVWLRDLPVAVLSPSGLRYVAPDQIGAPHQMVDGRGQVVWLWDHDPFGNGEPTGPGIVTTNLRYPGQYFDQNAKLHYNGFRDYDPNTGRYIESDPTGLGGGINTYIYAKDHPVNTVDPQGLNSFSVPAGQSQTTPGGYTVSTGSDGVSHITDSSGKFYADVQQGKSVDLPDGTHVSNDTGWALRYGDYQRDNGSGNGEGSGSGTILNGHAELLRPKTNDGGNNPCPPKDKNGDPAPNRGMPIRWDLDTSRFMPGPWMVPGAPGDPTLPAFLQPGYTPPPQPSPTPVKPQATGDEFALPIP